MYEMSAEECDWADDGYLNTTSESIADRNQDGTISWSEAKEHQIQYGDSFNMPAEAGRAAYDSTVFPIIRCFHHAHTRTVECWNDDKTDTERQPVTLNVSYAGNIFDAPLQWERTK